MKKTVDQELDDAVEYFESSYYILPSFNGNTGATQYNKGSAPLHSNVRKLKRKRADYRPGPVKVYTRAEIEEYEETRDA